MIVVQIGNSHCYVQRIKFRWYKEQMVTVQLGNSKSDEQVAILQVGNSQRDTQCGCGTDGKGLSTCVISFEIVQGPSNDPLACTKYPLYVTVTSILDFSFALSPILLVLVLNSDPNEYWFCGM